MSERDDLQLWDAAAQRYAEHVTGTQDSFYRRLEPFLVRHLGDLRGRRVLDVGCGHGWLSEHLRRQGAEVTGVDGSAALVERARRDWPDVRFLVHDLTRGLPEPHERYDRLVAHMVLMDVPDLDDLVADVRSCLEPDGVGVVTMLHPAFFAQQPVADPAGGHHRRVTGYLEHTTRWITSFGGHHHYHRPLSWYVEVLARHGLVVTGMDEPRTLPGHVAPEREWTAYERWFATIPTMVAVAFRPAPESWT